MNRALSLLTICLAFLSQQSLGKVPDSLPLPHYMGIYPNGTSRVKRDSLCNPTETTTSGDAAVTGQICSTDMIFRDDFDSFNLSIWSHEYTMAGGGERNLEFEWYTKDAQNAFAKNGKLFIKPSITAYEYGEDWLYNATVDLGSECTNSNNNGCRRQGQKDSILPPVKSARLRTHTHFSYKYGYMEVSAKAPSGDWMWPAIWLLPEHGVYGTWPASGEIDILETRGNAHLWQGNNDIGVTLGQATLNYGPDTHQNGRTKAFGTKHIDEGFNKNFHKFGFEWTPDYIKWFYDEEQIGYVNPGTNFWDYYGKFTGDNPWKNGKKMAPFDQEFYLLLNLAIGGNFFPDNVGDKPWKNFDPRACTDFWEKRNQWLDTWPLWKNSGDDAALQIDYIHIWAL